MIEYKIKFTSKKDLDQRGTLLEIIDLIISNFNLENDDMTNVEVSKILKDKFPKWE